MLETIMNFSATTTPPTNEAAFTGVFLLAISFVYLVFYFSRSIYRLISKMSTAYLSVVPTRLFVFSKGLIIKAERMTRESFPDVIIHLALGFLPAYYVFKFEKSAFDINMLGALFLIVCIVSMLLYVLYWSRHIIQKLSEYIELRILNFTFSLWAAIFFDLFFVSTFKGGSALLILVNFTIFASLFICFVLPEIELKRGIKNRHAPGSISINNDKLGMKETAKLAAKRIQGLSRCVEVVAINGRFGSGKSSLCRMIIETLPSEKTLYLYVSLAEACEKDFSTRFSDEWCRVFSRHYSEFSVLAADSSVVKLLDETVPQKWIVRPFLWLWKLTLPKTRNRTSGDEMTEAFDNSGMFAGIKRLRHNQIIIVIDELDRATLDELYRVIENIEKFKIEFDNGAPAQLVFILNVDIVSLKAHLLNFVNEDWRAQLILDFLEGSKQLKEVIQVPVNFHLQKIHIVNRIKEIAGEFNIDILNWKDFQFNGISTTSGRSFETDPIQALSIVASVMLDLSLRELDTVFANVQAYYRMFSGDPVLSKIRLADVLAIKQIELKWITAITFFQKVLPSFLDSRAFGSDSRFAKRGAFKYYGSLGHKEFPYKSLSEWVSGVVDVDFKTPGFEHFRELMAICANPFVSYVEENADTPHNAYYLCATFSNTTTLDLYLNYAERGVISQTHILLVDIFNDQNSGGEKFKTLDESNLLGYGPYILPEGSASNKMVLSWCLLIGERLLSDKFQAIASAGWDSPDLLAAENFIAYAHKVNHIVDSKGIGELADSYLKLVSVDSPVALTAKMYMLYRIFIESRESKRGFYYDFSTYILNNKKNAFCKILAGLHTKIKTDFDYTREQLLSSGHLYLPITYLWGEVFQSGDNIVKSVTSEMCNSQEGRESLWRLLDWDERWDIRNIEATLSRYWSAEHAIALAKIPIAILIQATRANNEVLQREKQVEFWTEYVKYDKQLQAGPVSHKKSLFEQIDEIILSHE